MSLRLPLRLRLNTTAPPATTSGGRKTLFGLQDRSQQLTSGVLSLDGQLTFTLELEVSQGPASGAVRFHSPFVHGPATARFLYLGWRYADGPQEWVRRQKLPLRALTWERLQSAAPVTFSAEIPTITEQCATIPVEWQPVGAET